MKKELQHNQIYFFAGEQSGDLNGSAIIKALKHNFPDLILKGVGGPLMRSEGLESHIYMESFQVMGFIDVFLALPKIIRLFYQVRKEILDLNPQAVVLIDYPGYNLRLAKSLKKAGYQGKIIQYVSPTVWAWGKKRVEILAKYFDQLFVLFPFEVQCYANTSLNVTYTGHPLVDRILPQEFEKDKNLIGLFPGSRNKEIYLNFPLMLKTAKNMSMFYPNMRFAISVANPKTEQIIHELLKQSPFQEDKLEIVYDSYKLMQKCRAALATSGTVTLELALHKTPAVVVYKLSLINALLAQWVFNIRLPFYCIVNILCKKQVYPELIHKEFTPKKAFQELSKAIQPQNTLNCQQSCDHLRKILTIEDGLQAGERVAKLIKNILEGGQLHEEKTSFIH